MAHVFDFLARLGEVFIGALVAIMVILVLIAVIIELIDFLVVDPITRNKTPDTPLKEDD